MPQPVEGETMIVPFTGLLVLDAEGRVIRRSLLALRIDADPWALDLNALVFKFDAVKNT